jgi:hypothetical protein
MEKIILKWSFNTFDWTLFDMGKGIPRCRWEGNIKRDLGEIDCKNVYGI